VQLVAELGRFEFREDHATQTVAATGKWFVEIRTAITKAVSTAAPSTIKNARVAR